MRVIRTRILAEKFTPVEMQDGVYIIRWDASPEMVPVRQNRNLKQGKWGEEMEREHEEPQEMKESGYLLCSEAAYRTLPPKEYLQDDMQADFEIRYPEGDAPIVDVDTIYEILSK